MLLVNQLMAFALTLYIGTAVGAPVSPVCPMGFQEKGSDYVCIVKKARLDDFEVAPVCPLGFVCNGKAWECDVTAAEINEF